MALKIFIVDDHGVLRAGLRALLNLEKDMQVVGEAGSPDEALWLIGEKNPDVVLMDISLAGDSGIELTKALIALQPGLRIVMLTIHEDETLLRAALQSGAVGYILKRAVESELITAIRTVAAGNIYIHPAMTRAHSDPIEARDAGTNTLTLTAREIEVLKLIVQGHTNRQMADLLSLSIRTVESHRSNIMGKLNLRSRLELVRYAAVHGLLETRQ